MVRTRFALAVSAALLLLVAAPEAHAGPEILLREFASGQVKKGVRSIGMGGDGATTGNYALVYKDAGGALFDFGVTRFQDTHSVFSFTAVGFTTPTFWDDAALYVIALSQHATDVHVWDFVPGKTPSHGDGSNDAVFVKLAKPVTKTISIGVMGAYELSQMTLFPNAGGPAVRFQSTYLPSGGAGIHWHPDEHWQLGARVILNHDDERRDDAKGAHYGLSRVYEYRLGGAYSPWRGTLLDVGASALDRSNELEGTSSFDIYPTVGAEQVLVRQRVWARAGLDETTWTTGMSLKASPFKIDVAYLYNLAAARTKDVFGKRNASLIVTVGFDYEEALRKK